MFFKNDKSIQKVKTLPLLPLREMVIFPYVVVPLFVGRQKSINALDNAGSSENEIFLVAQEKGNVTNPAPEDIYNVGTIAKIVQLLRWQDGTVTVLVEGKKRARIKRYLNTDSFFQVEVEELTESYEKTIELEALMRTVQSIFEVYVKINKIAPETILTIQTIDDPSKLADSIAVHLNTIKIENKQLLLETDDPSKRLEKLYSIIQREIEILQAERKIRAKIKQHDIKNSRILNSDEAMPGLPKDAQEKDEFKNELDELEEKINKKKLSPEAEDRVKKEFKKLKLMSPLSAEATVVRNYIDWILSLPWGIKTEENFDLSKAEKILEEDHYGLRKIKERILEYLAVQALVKKLKGPILCFVGPPGTGKTSLSKSIGRATGRKFVRLSLGGVRDEAEVRGHRRTYIGALPGKILQCIKKIATDNPVFLLDEVDKMTSDYRGDPASALLEVLDPEQNYMFNDHYIDLDYDLSDVLFITTANTLEGIPIPLRDRMEIIELSSYTEFEKLNIAKNYLISKQKKECGLENIPIEITESGIRTIINYYTKEAGVRSLEREIASIFRKLARKVLKEGANEKIEISAQEVTTYLGIPKYNYGKSEQKDQVGVSNGLAVTMFGGDLLTVEVAMIPGKGELILTGKLGEVMQESAKAALSYVRSRAKRLGIDPMFYKECDIHIHFPEGAVPKDGPSAGITIATTIVSALMNIPIKHDIAMTGEITLRGRVLPIGGLKEKILAAHRGLVKSVIIPKENRKDLKEVPTKVLKSLRIVLVNEVDDVLAEALVNKEIRNKLEVNKKERWEYINGKMVKIAPENDKPIKSDEPEPDIEPSSAVI